MSTPIQSQEVVKISYGNAIVVELPNGDRFSIGESYRGGMLLVTAEDNIVVHLVNAQKLAIDTTNDRIS